MSDITDHDALRILLDRQAIWDCVLRYTRGVDRLDESLIRSAFWEDAHDSHGQVNGGTDDFLDYWLPTQPEREAAQHFVTNHTVELDGDDGADTETYFISTAKKVGSDRLEMVGGRYMDRFEKRDGEWRIKTRLVVLDWHCSADASQMADRLSRSHSGSRSPADPSYERPVRPRHTAPGTAAGD